MADMSNEPCKSCGIGERAVFPSQVSSYCKDCLTIRRVATARKHLYGITEDQYNEMLAVTDGRCYVCGLANENGRTLCVDHDHNTDAIRGLLCLQCNVALGMAQDDPKLLRQLAEYLEKFAESVGKQIE